MTFKRPRRLTFQFCTKNEIEHTVIEKQKRKVLYDGNHFKIENQHSQHSWHIIILTDKSSMGGNFSGSKQSQVQNSHMDHVSIFICKAKKQNKKTLHVPSKSVCTSSKLHFFLANRDCELQPSFDPHTAVTSLWCSLTQFNKKRKCKHVMNRGDRR